MTQGILEFPRAEILGSSPRMTKNTQGGNFERYCFVVRFTHSSQWRNFERNFKWDCFGRFVPSQWRRFDEIPRSSRGMTQNSPRMTKNASRGMTQGLGNFRIFVIASEAKQSHLLRLERYCFGILNEIASVALLPRNDGNLMRSPDQVGGWHKA